MDPEQHSKSGEMYWSMLIISTYLQSNEILPCELGIVYQIPPEARFDVETVHGVLAENITTGRYGNDSRMLVENLV